MIRTVVLSLSLLVAAATAAASSLHLRLVKSEPADKAVVAARPAAVRLWFSAEPEMRYTSVTMKNAAGAAVVLAKPHQHSTSKSLIVAEVTGALAPGKYAVTWRTVSRDGHPVKGEFRFELTTASRADD